MYVLIVIVKKKVRTDVSLYTFLQLLGITAFEKVAILQLVTDSDCKISDTFLCNQVKFCD